MSIGKCEGETALIADMEVHVAFVTMEDDFLRDISRTKMKRTRPLSDLIAHIELLTISRTFHESHNLSNTRADRNTTEHSDNCFLYWRARPSSPNNFSSAR